MSTVPEAIVARQCGLNVAAVSCITNLAAGISPGKLSHAEVLKTGEAVKTLAAKLLKSFSELYGRPPPEIDASLGANLVGARSSLALRPKQMAMSSRRSSV